MPKKKARRRHREGIRDVETYDTRLRKWEGPANEFVDRSAAVIAYLNRRRR